MKKPAIVCVDDQKMVLMSLNDHLTRNLGENYDIKLAESGTEALSIFAQSQAEGTEIPVIIADQIMPGMQGDELLENIHALYPKVLTIMLTGHADAEVIANAVNSANLYRYINKPWNETDLILTVKEALRSYHQEQQLAEQNEVLHKVNGELEKSLSLLQATLESTADGVLALDMRGRVSHYNQKFLEMWDIPSSLDLCQDRKIILDYALRQLNTNHQLAIYWRSRDTQLPMETHDCFDLKNGKTLECFSQPQRLNGKIVGRVWSFRDITAQKSAEATIKHQALHDALTGLPNRTFFNQRLSEELTLARQTQNPLGVMFIDLDHFKMVNDTLGHDVGDHLLQEAVQRLTECLRSQDLIARWGGDEFTVLLPELNTREDATDIARRILNNLKPAFDLQGNFIHVTSSIGIAVYPEDGQDSETLLKNADAALYRAKERGRNDYQHYTITINSHAYELLHLENSLHTALEKEEFVLHYQPQINTTTGQITHMEVLLRWFHPTLGFVSPKVFIPLAEQNGLIIPLGEWVIQKACEQNQIWQKMGLPPIGVAVNLSARQLRCRQLLNSVERILQETGLDSRFLELEVTETAAMQDIDLSRSLLANLSEMGISIAMDDFGTGYSSLSYLKQFPLDTIKIDQSFVRDLPTNPHDTAIVNAIVALGKGLNLKVVAEGVETEELRDLLETLSCEHMQGYFFSKPLPSKEATDLLKRQHLLGSMSSIGFNYIKVPA